MKEVDLPLWPSGGNRRRLDAQWLEQVKRHGLAAFLSELPTGAPRELLQAVEEFNNGLYWECHETLEDVWRQTPYPLRLYYHAIIKAAVGFHHLYRHNRHGARTKLADAVAALPLFQPAFMGVRTDLLLEETEEWLERVDQDGPVHWAALEALARPRMHLT